MRQGATSLLARSHPELGKAFTKYICTRRLHYCIVETPPLEERSTYCVYNFGGPTAPDPVGLHSACCVCAGKQHVEGPTAPRELSDIIRVVRLYSKIMNLRHPITRRAFHALHSLYSKTAVWSPYSSRPFFGVLRVGVSGRDLVCYEVAAGRTHHLLWKARVSATGRDPVFFRGRTRSQPSFVMDGKGRTRHLILLGKVGCSRA